MAETLANSEISPKYSRRAGGGRVGVGDGGGSRGKGGGDDGGSRGGRGGDGGSGSVATTGTESGKYSSYDDDNDSAPSDLFSPTFASPGDTIQAPNIPFDTLVFGSKLGSGTFGTVYKGSVRGVVVAIKVLKATAINIEDLLQEVGIMSHLRFSYIVTMHGVCFHEDHLYIVSEFLPCGDLEHWLSDKNKEISYIPKLKILKDVAMAMNWLHSSDPPVIHRDLKPANVLLTTSRRPGDEETILQENRVKEIERDLMAKVTDMGLSKVLNTNQQLKADGAGSNLWMAPELLKYQFYDEKVDCYSFALLIWQVLTWTKNPFQDYLDRGDLDVFVEAVYYGKVRPTIPPTLKVHKKLLEIMDAGWAHHARDRPDFTEIAMGLDDCLISTLFKDEEYANFWKQYWGARVIHQERRVQPAKEIIPWAIFVRSLYEYLKTYGVNFPENPESDVYYLCLKAMIIDPKLDAVSIERLLLVEKWFGPLIQLAPTPVIITSSIVKSQPILPVEHLALNLSSRTLSTPSSPSHLRTPNSAKHQSSSPKGLPKVDSTQQVQQTPKSPKTPKTPPSNNRRGSVKDSKPRESSKSTRSRSKKDSETLKTPTPTKKYPRGSVDDVVDDKVITTEREKVTAQTTVPEKSSPTKRPKTTRETAGIITTEDKSPRKEIQKGKSLRKVKDDSDAAGVTHTKTRPRTNSQLSKTDLVRDRGNKSRSQSAAQPPTPISRSKSTNSRSAARQRTFSKLPKFNTLPKERFNERPEERTLLGAIKRILEQAWFHGDISKEDADSSLATNKMIEGPKIFGVHGDFLVRLSLSEPVDQHPFTITKVNKKGVIFHQRIFYKEDESRYIVYTKAEGIPEVSADNLISLVRQLVELKIVNQPCKRWNYARKYADIFEKKLSHDGGYLDIDDLSGIANKL